MKLLPCSQHAAALLVAGVFTVSNSAPCHAQADEAFDRGVQLYLAGKAEEAVAEFQKVLAENPSNEDAIAYLDKGGFEVFQLMLGDGGEYETIAQAFLGRAKVARKEKMDDAEAISALVDQAMNGDYVARRDALLTLSRDHGEYGAAPFVPFLGNEDNPEERVSALLCLNALSVDSVLPLIAALASDNDRLVRNACACLGNIGDVRAVPGLKQVFETTSNTVTQATADEALRKITGSNAKALPDANGLHIQAAMDLFNRDDRIVHPYDTKDAIWSLEGGEVVAEKVPAMLRHLRLAEQNCFDVVGNQKARAVLFAVYAAENAALRAGLAAGGELDEDRANELMARNEVSMASGGSAGLSAALQFCLDHQAPMAAVEVIRSLAATGDRCAALDAALGSDYGAVRYEAAFALANGGHVDGKVVNTLVHALNEDAIRTVLVVDDRDSVRNQLVSVLTEAGFAVVTADNGPLGLARARQLPPKDLVVLRADVGGVTLADFVYDSDHRSSASPILVLTGSEDEKSAVEAMYEGKGKVAGFLAAPADMGTLLEAAEAAMSEMNDERAAALAVSERAASILAHLPSSALSADRADLLRGLDRDEESVLVPVLRAVATLGSTEAANKVRGIFEDTSRSDDVRVAAANALGGILSQSVGNPGNDVIESLRSGALGDSSAAVKVAASRALGSAAFLTDEQRAEFLKAQR